MLDVVGVSKAVDLVTHIVVIVSFVPTEMLGILGCRKRRKQRHLAKHCVHLGLVVSIGSGDDDGDGET
jgi:hypothetical protein